MVLLSYWQISIYIPLWFYSNDNAASSGCHPDSFTFHYGSILMPYSSSQYLPIQLFTFHYGSILILWDRYINIPSVYIYIPLWFYSNISMQLKVFSPMKFTFHYGSILIFFSSSHFLSYPIYIPLWFYSNEQGLKVQGDIIAFTFHYGSILILILMID